MKMQIDFYSKEELAIQIDTSGKMSFSQTETSELFLFSSYVLRQLRNMGTHLVAKSLAGFLVSETYFKNLIGEDAEIPKADLLLDSMDLHVLMSQPKELDIEQLAPLADKLTEERFSINPTYFEIFDKDYGSRIPKVTKFMGSGKKSFALTFPPFQLSSKGFGILERDANYYIFHSAIGLIRFLGQKHQGNSELLNNLWKVGMYCGSYYIFNKISLDQATQAMGILETAGISIN